MRQEVARRRRPTRRGGLIADGTCHLRLRQRLAGRHDCGLEYFYSVGELYVSGFSDCRDLAVFDNDDPVGDDVDSFRALIASADEDVWAINVDISTADGPDVRGLVTHREAKIFRRERLHWTGRVHEWLVPTNAETGWPRARRAGLDAPTAWRITGRPPIVAVIAR